jgi:hypothetical protein
MRTVWRPPHVLEAVDFRARPIYEKELVPMTKPVITVGDDPKVLPAVELDLRHRYASDVDQWAEDI